MNFEAELIEFLERRQPEFEKIDIKYKNISLVTRLVNNLESLTKYKTLEKWNEEFKSILEKEEADYKLLPELGKKKNKMVFSGAKYEHRNRTNYLKMMFKFSRSNEGFDFWNELMKVWSKEGADKLLSEG